MKKPTTPTPNIGPVTLVVPNTTEKKMEAIVALSGAVLELSRALNSTNVQATISHCVISSSKCGISIQNV